jgi:2-polyprenyl-3-methyl-5-hydroxy-6-metoxy-1,4-benzoquinol methylase
MNSNDQTTHWLNHYDQQAKSLSDEHEMLDFSNEDTMNQIHEIVVDIVARNTDNGDTVVDAGCGTGRVFGRLCGDVSSDDVTLVGIDLSKQLLSYARKRAAKHLPNSWTAAFLQSDLSRPALEHSIADVTVCTEALQHMPPREGVISLLDVTSPGGKLVVSVPNAENPIIQNAVRRNGGQYYGVELDRFIERIRTHTPTTAIEVLPLVFRDDQSKQPYHQPEVVSASSYTSSERPNRYIIRIDL